MPHKLITLVQKRLHRLVQDRWWRVVEAAGAGESLTPDDQAFLAAHECVTAQAQADRLLLDALRQRGKSIARIARLSS